MELVLAVIIIFSLYKVSCVERPKKEEKTEEPHVYAYDVAIERAGNASLIQEWVEDTRKGRRLRVIAEWKYVQGYSDKIMVRFRGQEDFVTGIVHFKTDHGNPRVSGFTWKEYGLTRRMSGVQLPQIPMATLVANFRMARQDARKLQYINDVAFQAGGGTAEFDVCAYEGITQEVFEQTFGKRELRALCEVLKDDFEVLRVEGSKIIVRLQTEPQM